MNRKIGVGVFWNLTNMILSGGATTIFTLFLARMLAPESFGLIAMLAIALELANHFVQSGLGQALIRSEEVSEKDLSTIFYANLGFSACGYIVLYSVAPYIAAFYGQADLTDLLRVMGIVVFLNAVKVVPIAILSRQMNFKLQAIANTTGLLVSGVLALVLAYRGGGAWSLVVQSLVAAGLSALILMAATRWSPGVQFSGASFRRLFGFGANLLAAGTVRILAQNARVVVIGRFFSAEIAGLYFFAKNFSQLISDQLSGAVQRATFPALATLQQNNDKVREKYRQIIQLTMFVISPVMVAIAVLAYPFFELLLGEKWLGAVIYTQILCVAAILYPLHAMNVNILNVKGRSDLVFKIGLAKNALNLTLLFAALPFGLLAIVISQVVASFIALAPNTYFTARLINYGLTQQVVDVAKPITAALLAGGFTKVFLWAAALGELWQLLLGSLVFGICFLASSWLMRVEALILLLQKGGVLRNRCSIP